MKPMALGLAFVGLLSLATLSAFAKQPFSGSATPTQISTAVDQGSVTTPVTPVRWYGYYGGYGYPRDAYRPYVYRPYYGYYPRPYYYYGAYPYYGSYDPYTYTYPGFYYSGPMVSFGFGY